MHLHTAHCYQDDGGNLGFSSELEVPDQEPWQNRKREVSDDAKGTIDICHSHDDIHFETASRLASVPIVRYRMALQQSDEEEDETRKNREESCGVYNPGIDSRVGNSK